MHPSARLADGLYKDTIERLYKDNLADGCKVAIKGGTGHKNVVKLVNFYQDEDEKLLLYEYKEMAHCITIYIPRMLTSWKMITRISLDTARGIDYIHNFTVLPVIHRDFKASNINLHTN